MWVDWSVIRAEIHPQLEKRMDITLPQAILLLSLNDETGRTETAFYLPALTGAALAEMFLRGSLELETQTGRAIPLRHSENLGAFLSMCDSEIGRAATPQPLSHWLAELANQKDFIATLADELCHLGALSQERTRVFGLFSRTVWPEASPVLETHLKAEMAQAMFSERASVDETLCLTIALAHAVDLLSYNFDAAELEQNADRIASIAAGQCLSSSATEAVMTSVHAAIEAANAASDSVTAQILN